MIDQLRPNFLMLLLAMVLVAATRLNAQEDDDDLPPYLPGLITTYSTSNGAPGDGFERIEDILSRQWDTPDPRLNSTSFQVQWRGLLLTPSEGQYRLALFIAGKVRLTLNGEVLIDGESDKPSWLTSETFELSFGRHPLRVNYTGESAGRIALYWSGPGFSLEPVGAPFLLHASDNTIDNKSEHGAELVRVLRCAACHQIPGQAEPIPAPDLRKSDKTILASWLRQWLGKNDHQVVRRMPNFQWENDELEALTAYLTLPDTNEKQSTKPNSKDIVAGRELVHHIGCLACHRIGEVGSQDLYSGGDLTQIAAKRPTSFFATWLKSPHDLNSNHRMPVFELSSKERKQIASYLATLGKPAAPAKVGNDANELRRRGRQLVASRGCAQCHQVEATQATKPPKRSLISASSAWQDSCLDGPTSKRPGYDLSEMQADAIKTYIQQLATDQQLQRKPNLGAQILRESNCVGCHQRNGAQGLTSQFANIANVHPQWAADLPAMRPPSLNSVGDKLHDVALQQAISKDAARRRPWLAVRMPRFALNDDQLQAIVKHFVQEDRIPPGNKEFAERDFQPKSSPQELYVSGRRLVTADGFGCTSCHAVGSVKPTKAPINATGADLLMLEKRIRRSWFDRWVRNPARIVPRMEMPSVQRPIHGVLGDQLDEQLGAVWHVLNRPDFVPPEPNPVRIVRRRNVSDKSAKDELRPAVITDVLHLRDQVHVKPLLIGLANRQNLLYDLESGRVLGWWTGDTARQHTKGKTWMWRPGGENLLTVKKAAANGSHEGRASELSIRHGQRWLTPKRRGQFVTEFDSVAFNGAAVTVKYRLDFAHSEDGGSDDGGTSLWVTETIEPLGLVGQGKGIRRSVSLSTNSQGPLQVRVAPPVAVKSPMIAATETGDQIRYASSNSTAKWSTNGLEMTVTSKSEFSVEYESALPADQFLTPRPVREPPEPAMLSVAPGFAVTRLPLGMEMMPTGIAWQPNGAMMISSLKGRIWQIVDNDGDHLEESATVFADDVAAPFGIAVPQIARTAPGVVDVVTKYALLRLTDADRDGVADRWERLASGWGHTADYHDWAIGLPQDQQGRYYLSTACQQDDRSQAAAKWRGVVLQLTPTESSTASGERSPQYAIDLLSTGHRFPVGIARNRQGDLFVTDNQGNFNPFNELNHVRKGKHFGFINKLDRGSDHKPPLTAPAINIPHPWTRSVNGICFLESPTGNGFGPYEGHLVGCEYDTRRLIRMSLETVGGGIQGAAYPLTRTPDDAEPLLGPLCAAVAPNGSLYVGCIRDSGWGGSNNVGTVARLDPKVDQLPAGIAEVRIAPDGFVIQWHGTIKWDEAAKADRYVVSSYRRVSTPAYGGPDIDRRDEKVISVDINREQNQVRVRLNPLRPGFVYEIRVQNIANTNDMFPAEAYYTVNAVPSK